MYCPLILHSKLRVDSPYNGLDMALFIPGLNTTTIRETAIFVRTYAGGAMFLYTSPLHVIRSSIVQRVVSKYGSLAASCFCQ